mmetsp:Transcript_32738/g.37398  ORF Transcript_32738/g.37398 Transcript_32738/m.37398 type:complete len:219 (+) Transcript_32738:1721-2377(+)
MSDFKNGAKANLQPMQVQPAAVKVKLGKVSQNHGDFKKKQASAVPAQVESPEKECKYQAENPELGKTEKSKLGKKLNVNAIKKGKAPNLNQNLVKTYKHVKAIQEVQQNTDDIQEEGSDSKAEDLCNNYSDHVANAKCASKATSRYQPSKPKQYIPIVKRSEDIFQGFKENDELIINPEFNKSLKESLRLSKRRLMLFIDNNDEVNPIYDVERSPKST